MQDESLAILEWPAVCRQVACFCRTPMAAERVQAGLKLGASRAECEALLQQTEEAAAATLPLDGILDLRPAVEAATRGWCLNAKQLEGVAASLEAALQLRAAACAKGEGAAGASSASGLRFPSLAALAEGISADEAGTVAALRGCIRGGAVTDEADEALAATRAERAANLAALRALVSGLSRDLAAKGAAESREPLLVRGRFCVAVRSNRRSELPKGSVRLGASASGATVYMEPAPAVDLNNRETELAAREAEQAAAVLARLSGLLAQRAPQLQALLEAVAALDVASARARHAAWLGGARPEFVEAAAEAADGAAAPASLISAPGALHPLLLEPALEPLPRAPTADDRPFAADFQAVPTFGALSAAGGAGGGNRRSGSSSSGGGGSRPRGERAARPRPLDLRVPAGKRVVAITGPNTGARLFCSQRTHPSASAQTERA